MNTLTSCSIKRNGLIFSEKPKPTWEYLPFPFLPRTYLYTVATHFETVAINYSPEFSQNQSFSKSRLLIQHI
jgi:hypothetical protein